MAVRTSLAVGGCWVFYTAKKAGGKWVVKFTGLEDP